MPTVIAGHQLSHQYCIFLLLMDYFQHIEYATLRILNFLHGRASGGAGKDDDMRKFMMVAVAVALSTAAPRLASAEITTETMAYTFALTLAGTVGAAILFPYVVPVAAPAVATTYAASVTTVDGVLSTAGSYIVLEPRMIGAVAGMTTGLITGLIFFAKGEEETGPVMQKTSNTVITISN
ncbi:MAG: hypothetical protein VCE75_28130 [Alphaproteobacteria bacterium]